VSAGTVDFYTSADFTNWTPLGTQNTGLATTAMDTGGTAPIVRLGTDADAEHAPGTYTKTQVRVNDQPAIQRQIAAWSTRSGGY
jgi:hypothetical protein